MKAMRFGGVHLKAAKIVLLVAIAAVLTLLTYQPVLAGELKAPELKWETSLGGTNPDTAYSVTESIYDDSYVFAGTTDNERKVYLAKVDNAGNTVWSQTFGGGYYVNVARAVYQTDDQGFIIAGYSRAQLFLGNDRIYLVKTDAAGNLVWEKRIFVMDGKSKAKAFAVQQTSDGGYIVAGSSLLGDQTDIYVCKTDANGEVMWDQYFGGGGWDSAYSLQETADKGFIIAGSIEGGNRALSLIKLNQFGGVEWERLFASSTSGNLQAKSVHQTSDGGYILTGYDSNKINLFKTDAGGKKLWDKTYSEGIGYSVDVAKDGGYIITGKGAAGIILIRTDKAGSKLWEKSLGTPGGTGFSVKYNQHNTIVAAGESGGNAYLAQLEKEQEAVLQVSSPSVLKNGNILVYTALKDEGVLVKTGAGDVKVKVDATHEEITLKDDGTDGDMSANDGIYSAWYTVTRADSVDIDLYIGGLKTDTSTVKVITNPKLAVVTDFKALWDEFKETGMLPEDDLDNNALPDYYDLLGRINRYAYAHDGIVFDLSHEITTAKGYAKEYKNLDYFTADVYDMGIQLDAFVNKLGAAYRFKYLALIGDDRVVPFYRVVDLTSVPADGEHKYPSEVGGASGNQTLRTSAADQIMTDVPYGSYDNTDPNTVPHPRLDVGVGRIFADGPDKLVKIMDAYESPVNLYPEERTAVLYSLKADHVNWPDAVNAGLLPVLNAQMQGGNQILNNNPIVYTPGQFYHYDGTVVRWSPDDVANAVNKANVTLFWSHADHVSELTQNNPRVRAATYDAMPESPGHLLIDTGCHSGYSVSQTGTNPNHYNDAMAASLMEKKVTYIAPTTYGIGAEPQLGYHDLLLSRCLENVLNGTNRTIGDAMVTSYTQYWTYILPDLVNNLSTYATYGTILYGLPTQPIENGGMVLPNPTPAPAPAPGPAPAPLKVRRSILADSEQPGLSKKFAVEIPNFRITTNSAGKSLIKVPNGGTQTLTDFAPSLPLVFKSFLLPYGSTVTDVQLTDVVSSIYGEPLDLQLTIPINRTHGPKEGSFALPDTYPETMFWWSTTEQNGGVLLTISIIPVQYDSASKLATLYSRLDFRVDYTAPLSATTLDGVTVNDGDGVPIGSADIPVKIAVTSPSEQNAGVFWTVKDPGGCVIASGAQESQLATGSNDLEFCFDTLNWMPGPKDLTVAIFDSVVLDTQTVQFDVYGIDLRASLTKETFSPADTSASVTVEVQDEQGALTAGLTSDNFLILLQDSAVSKTGFAKVSPGVYTIEFALDNLAPGVYPLKLECSDSRGVKKSLALHFRYKNDATPPQLVSTNPSDQAAAVPADAEPAVKYNEPITWGAAFNEITITAGAENVKFTARFNGDEFILMPETDFSTNTTYTVHIPAGAVEDLAWNTSTDEYSFSFTTLPGSNAGLADLTLGGSTVAGFAYDNYSYNVVLPYGTAIVPEIRALPAQAKSIVEIIPAADVWGTAQIKVTAEDGVTAQTYTIKFSVAKNSDAALCDLQVDGETVTGFSAAKTAYFYVLPYGTTEVPAVTARPNDSKARLVVTPAASLNGTATIQVTAEDGTAKTYTIKFSVARKNDAALKTLLVDGQLIGGFSANKLAYQVKLPDGTTQIPSVTAEANDPGAWVETIQAPAVPGSALVMVTAADGIAGRLYSVTFSVYGNSDASLKDLKVGDTTIRGFDPNIFNYLYVLPYGTTEVPSVSAEVYDQSAAIEVSQATDPRGTATVRVVSQDGKTACTYAVVFRVAANNGALLSDLQLDGGTIAGFSGETLNYQVTLPSGTAKIPLITAVPLAEGSVVTITQADTLPGTARITVTSEDGKMSRLYTVSFAVAESNSTDLSEIRVNDVSIQGFSADTLNYAVTLQSGTSRVPTVMATTADPQAKAKITQASGVTGTARILVTSSDGRMTKVYSVKFDVVENVSADLKDLKAAGKTVDGFDKDTLNYVVVLPAGTLAVPAIAAEAADPGARVDIAIPDDLSGAAAIKVTARDGIMTKTYQVNFQVLCDALLKSLKVTANGTETSLSGFKPEVLNYEVVLPFGTAEIPQISAIPNDSAARVSITQAAAVNGVASVKVVSADGRITRTYSVKFTVRYQAPTISSNLGTVVVGTENDFQVTLVANSEAGTIGRVKVQVDPLQAENIALYYQEIKDSKYYPMSFDQGTAWFGPQDGFTIGDAVSAFKVQFSAPGTYAYRLSLVEQGSNQELASADYSVTVLAEDTGGGTEDTEGPVVFSTIPAENHPVDINTNTPIHIMFDEQITAGPAINDVSIKMGGTDVQFTYQIDGVVLKLIPTQELAPGTSYEISIPAGAVQDQNGNQLEERYTFGFTTRAVLDTNADLKELLINGKPVDGFTPTQLAYAVELPYRTTTAPVVTAVPADEHAAVTITQAESVTGTATVKVTAEDGTTTKTYEITFTLAKPTGGGGSRGGSTVASKGPVVVSTVPAENHPVNVNTNTPIHIRFNAQIAAGPAIKDISIKTGQTDIQFTYLISGVVLKLIPVQDLAPGTDYEISIPAGAVQNQQGNKLEQPYTFGFTTAGVLEIPGVGGPNANPFTDLPDNHWARNEIIYLYNNKIVTGYPDSSFRPKKEITRAQLAAIMVKVLKLDQTSAPDKCTYTDVSQKHWAYREIETATKYGVMIGYGNGKFKPDSFVAREELFKVIINALHYKGKDNYTGSEDVLRMFVDEPKIPFWARREVAEAVESNIVKGVRPNVFGAGTYATREQIGVSVYKLLALI